MRWTCLGDFPDANTTLAPSFLIAAKASARGAGLPSAGREGGAGDSGLASAGFGVGLTIVGGGAEALLASSNGSGFGFCGAAAGWTVGWTVCDVPVAGGVVALAGVEEAWDTF